MIASQYYLVVLNALTIYKKRWLVTTIQFGQASVYIAKSGKGNSHGCYILIVVLKAIVHNIWKSIDYLTVYKYSTYDHLRPNDLMII